jgi:hypothetical protein
VVHGVRREHVCNILKAAYVRIVPAKRPGARNQDGEATTPVNRG